MRPEQLQTIIDTLEANGSIDTMVQYFEKQVSWHRRQVNEAVQAIARHEIIRDTNQEQQENYEALVRAFKTLKEEEE